jgi:uncharacterized membrane protein
MPLTKLLLSYTLSFIVFLIIDFIWLGLIAKDMYKKQIGHLMADQVNWIAALIFYLLFVAGVFVFAILPAVEKNSWSSAVILGALFGMFTYATYDLTNLATLKAWPIKLVFIDIIWGMFLTGSVAIAGFHIVKFVK